MGEVILLSHGFQQEYEVGFANGIARNGLRVTLVGSDSTLRQRLDASVSYENLRGSQQPDRPIAEKLFNILRYWLAYLRFLLGRRAIPVHVIGSFSTGSALLTLFEAWLLRVVTGGYALTVHNVLPHDRHTRFNAFLARLTYKSAKRVVVHTRKMAVELTRNFGLEEDRIVVVEHGIDRLLPDVSGERNAMRERLGINKLEHVILFFGTVAPYKGLDILLTAFTLEASKSVDRLVIAGRCTSRALARRLQETVESHPRRAGIVWIDRFLDDTEVAPLFHACDVLVMPYRHIDQSGVLFTAYATGTRVIVTDVGSLREYVHPPIGQVVPPENPSALANAIRDFFDEAVDPKPLCRFAEQYLWERTVRPVVAAYQQL